MTVLLVTVRCLQSCTSLVLTLWVSTGGYGGGGYGGGGGYDGGGGGYGGGGGGYGGGGP